MSKIQADCETVTQTNSASRMSVKLTHINHVYKHNHSANLMHQQSHCLVVTSDKMKPRYVCKQDKELSTGYYHYQRVI
jgi:hypothetical protein